MFFLGGEQSGDGGDITGRAGISPNLTHKVQGRGQRDVVAKILLGGAMIADGGFGATGCRISGIMTLLIMGWVVSLTIVCFVTDY